MVGRGTSASGTEVLSNRRNAFYSGLDAPASTAWENREESIPLPGRDEGYARALLVGTIGAGKTTLLRHLVGSDPRTDRFPSTSPGRTTTADIEVVTAADDHFSAVVTFLSDKAVRNRVQECVSEAILVLRCRNPIEFPHFAQDLLGVGGPREGHRVLIAPIQVASDRVDQLVDAGDGEAGSVVWSVR